jgi:hypothetical protein
MIKYKIPCPLVREFNLKDILFEVNSIWNRVRWLLMQKKLMLLLGSLVLIIKENMWLKLR